MHPELEQYMYNQSMMCVFIQWNQPHPYILVHFFWAHELTLTHAFEDTSHQNPFDWLRLNMSVSELPDCPKDLECSITASGQVMEEPVVAEDTHTYDKKAIEGWFAHQAANGRPTTSPMTGLNIGTGLVPNQKVKTQIKEWVERHQSGEADAQQLTVLQGQVFAVTTSEGALSLIRDRRRWEVYLRLCA